MNAILVVAPFLPYPADFGGAIRIFELIRYLSREREIILLAPARNPAGEDFAAIQALGEFCDVTAVPASSTARDPAGRGKRIRQLAAIGNYRSATETLSYVEAMQHAMDRLFQTRFIDLVLYEFPQTTFYRPPDGVPTILDAHNIEHLLLKRVALESDSIARAAFNTVEWRKLRRFERRAWRSVDLCLATSDQDAEIIETATGRETPVIPNGVDVASYTFREANKILEPRIIFVGTMRHQPNAAGAVWMAREVFPKIRERIPNVELWIVGADPPPSVQRLAGDGIVVTGRVDDVRPYLDTAAVAVAPLHSGSGTRLKILEAFAAGVPVVSTWLGAEGIDAEDGEHLLLADRADDFASAVAALIDDPARRAGLARRARALVEHRYGWESIAEQLDELLDTMRLDQ